MTLITRRNALKLFGNRYRTGTRTSRLATDIDQARPGTQHRLGMAQGRIALTETPAVGEGIGGYIEDAHHLRAT